jgi:hypothetical protein
VARKKGETYFRLNSVLTTEGSIEIDVGSNFCKNYNGSPFHIIELEDPLWLSTPLPVKLTALQSQHRTVSDIIAMQMILNAGKSTAERAAISVATQQRYRSQYIKHVNR